MSSSTPIYQYQALPPGTIRVLRLLPDVATEAPIRCHLFVMPLPSLSMARCSYDALSYVWGGMHKMETIIIEGHRLPVTVNLFGALTRLRDCCVERLLWVDAICINQREDGVREKEQQIQMMWEIYCLASRVIVWLGGAADGSDDTLEVIRSAGDRNSTYYYPDLVLQKGILALIRRSWFRRVWVLQEVGAARQITVMCGLSEIDGYAFYAGVIALNRCYEDEPDLLTSIPSVMSLMGRAIFRSHNTTQSSGSLADMIDKYHTWQASYRHDKVYALLGMSHESVDKKDIVPDYGLPWETLLRRLANTFLGEQISVESAKDREIVAIKSKSRVLGVVSSVKHNGTMIDSHDVKIRSKERNPLSSGGSPSVYADFKSPWTLQTSAKPIRVGDLLCFLEGASRPTIVRSYKDYFIIIKIALEYPSLASMRDGTWSQLFEEADSAYRNMLLIWDWETPMEDLQDFDDYGDIVKTDDWVPDDLHRWISPGIEEFDGDIVGATRFWNASLLLCDAGEYQQANNALREAEQGFGKIFDARWSRLFKSQGDPTHDRRFGWLTLVIESLLGMISPKLTISQTLRIPFIEAVKFGYEAIADWLSTEKGMQMDSKDGAGRTPFSWAAANGQTSIFSTLLARGEVELDSTDAVGRTPLSWASGNGHTAIVSLLLSTRKVEVNSRDKVGRTPFSWAAGHGQTAVVVFLLATGKIELNSKDHVGRSPVSWAAGNGRAAVVSLLLGNDLVDVESKDQYNQTPLFHAANNMRICLQAMKGNNTDAPKKSEESETWKVQAEATGDVIKLLLATSKVDADSENHLGETPRSFARVHTEAGLRLLRYEGPCSMVETVTTK